MRQKYEIACTEAKFLRIREFSVLGRNSKNIKTSCLRENDYTLMCEETYESDRIVRSISEGMESLVKALRTPNMFPIQTTIYKIAESVRELYNLAEKETVELLFDDKEFFPKGLE